MTKKPQRLLLITILLTVLLISSVYAILTPSAQAAEPTLEEKASSILGNVLNLNLAKYTPTVKVGPQDSYMGIVPEDNIRYILENDGSKVDALCSFTNGNLRMMYMLENQGSPVITKLAEKQFEFGKGNLYVIDILETAKSFLVDYRSQTGNSFYGQLSSMLDNIDDDKNLTKTAGNVKLDVNITGDTTIYKWTYIFNGLEAPDKCIALGYKSGFLQYFIDNWDLYRIGSTTVNISEKEAIDIAMEQAKGFAWNMGSDNNSAKIMGFKVTNAMVLQTVFTSSTNTDILRGSDPLMLYPVRHVWVSLDKFYPGNVYGIEVYVWADSGAICYMHERISTIDPPANLIANSNDYKVEGSTSEAANDDAVKSSLIPFTGIVFSVFAVVMLGTTPFWLQRKKSLQKQSYRVGGILLCLLLSLSMLLIQLPTVGAVEPSRRSLIWGSESTGDTSFWNGSNWVTGRKTANEISRQRVTSNAISNYLRDDGYVTSNNQGTGSIKAEILNSISDAEVNYSRVAVVDFDHGVGHNESSRAFGEFHYMFEDNIGMNTSDPEYIDNNYVFDMDIYDETAGKTFFALINTCLSACIDDTVGDYNASQGIVNPNDSPQNQRARGMPFAWTHLLVTENPNTDPPSGYMSRNGYTHPDGGINCYIGFPFGSASLNQTITGIAPIYATWLEKFFWYALSYDISVNDALDEASLFNFNNLFSNTDLYNSFGAEWPMWNSGAQRWEAPPYIGSTLAVYGNGNIHLYQYFVHDYVAATSYGYAGVNNPDGIEGGSNDDSYATLYALGSHDDQAVITGSIGWNPIGHIYIYGNTNPGYNSLVQVWVSYYGGSGWVCVNDDIHVTQTSPGWIDVGEYQGFFNYIAIVTYYDSQPSILHVDSVLVIPEPNEFSARYWVQSLVSSTGYGNGYVDNPEGIVHSYNDDDYAQIYGWDYYDDGGVIVGAMNGEVHGQIYFYGYSIDTYWSHYYVYVSYYNNNDWVQTTEDWLEWSGVGWVDGGYYGNYFRYIAIVAVNDGMPVNLFVDSVRVHS